MNLKKLKKEAAKYGAEVNVYPSHSSGGKLFYVDLEPENGLVWADTGGFTLFAESAPRAHLPHSEAIAELIERMSHGTENEAE